MFLKKSMLVLVLTIGLGFNLQAQDSKKTIKEIAQKFVEAADVNDAAMMTEVLHPESLQFISMGPKLIKSPAPDYIAAVEAKKIGGERREITFKNVELLGTSTAIASLNAVSSKYNFTYHLSLAKAEGKWVIVGIMTEIHKANG